MHFGLQGLEVLTMLSLKSNLSLFYLYYAKACNKLAGLIIAPAGNTPPFEDVAAVATMCPIRLVQDLNLRPTAQRMTLESLCGIEI